MKGCQQLEADLALYLEGDLPSNDEARIQAHVAACDVCRELLEGLRRSQRALKQLRSEDVERAVYDTVRDRVLERIKEARAPHVGQWRAWGLAAAAGLTLVVAGSLVFRPSRPEPRAAANREVLTERSTPQPATPIFSAASAPEPRPTPRAVAAVSKRRLGGSQPTLIKLLTDDPDIVIYWLVDENGGEP